MTDPHGFLKTPRRPVPRRPVEERLGDWAEVHDGQALLPVVSEQAGRCMDCGIPFCHQGCPLGNLIPEWNTYAAHGDWRTACERLHATDNFPEFTGRICPAPCEEACVLAINSDPVTIRDVEQAVVDEGWQRGYVRPCPPTRHTGMAVAVVGSGPAGLAAAQQLTRAGHAVTVYERADRLGGLLRYGIPAFKLGKDQLERRLDQMRAEGTEFRTGVDVGPDLDAAGLARGHDAVVLAVGARERRELPVPGRGLRGIHQAMEYLVQANRVAEGDYPVPPVTAEGRHVVIIGGGDTASDCMGTALRQHAASVVQLDINPRPEPSRGDAQPWPVYPRVYRISHAHEEAAGWGGRDPRVFATATLGFEGGEDGAVSGLRLTEVDPAARSPRPGTERVLPAELVLLALGFSGAQWHTPLARQLRLVRDPHGTIARDDSFAALAVDAAPASPPEPGPAPGGGPESGGVAEQGGPEGVFVAGDAGRGQSLVVWAIAEGRAAAAAADRYLTGATELPAPIAPGDHPLAV
ncbi:glutamate synthase subunit beta [Actinacidiphila yeochonensis]|uniref:glutamate synthase subunit beta n=1 Tax=Actinacidiphila yeochonensis TaxID=89050 RepID=UPI00055F69FB|nr:glutamate synthase subunit beta [Actinacidiphila yeochonensis]